MTSSHYYGTIHNEFAEIHALLLEHTHFTPDEIKRIVRFIEMINDLIRKNLTIEKSNTSLQARLVPSPWSSNSGNTYCSNCGRSYNPGEAGNYCTLCGAKFIK